MALENVLIRPNILNRELISGEDRLADILLELFSRLLRDTATGGTARQKLETAMTAALQRLQTDVQGRLEAAGQAFKEWLQPFLQVVEDLKEKTSGGTGNLMDVLEAILTWVETALTNADTDAIEAKLMALVDIVENTLGITRTRIAAMLNEIVDQAVAALTAAYLGGDFSRAATNEFMIGTYIESLREHLRSESVAPLLNFDLRQLLRDCIEMIREAGWDEMRNTVGSFITKIKDFAGGAGGLMGAFSGGIHGQADVNGPQDPVSWYASWFKGSVTGVADRFDLSGESFVNEMRLEPIPLGFLEHFAHVSSILMDLTETVLHLVSNEMGDRVSNIANGIIQLGKALITIGIHDSNDQSWVDAYKFLGNWWGEYLSSIGLNFFWSMESTYFSGPHPDGGARPIFYFTLLGKDVVELLVYTNWTELARDFFLTLFTLINADTEKQPGSKNQDKVEGFSLPLAELMVWLAARIGGWRKYGFPLFEGVPFFVLQWILGFALGWAGAVVGWFLGAALANEWPSEGSFGNISWRSLVSSALKWPIYWYYTWDGKTKDGKRGQTGSGPNDEVTFPGYAPRESSPYKMPFLKDTTLQCAQNNLGIWSHNSGTDQIYAIDFAHDHSTEVLAMRGGTVVEFSDELENHTTIRDNNISISHNDPTEPISPNPIHDRDHTGVVSTTCHYVHGAYAGVRQAFAIRGIPANRIVGTPIRQGQFIMFSGDTGISAYNHLHIHVGSPNCRSIPYVFRDVEKGAPSDLTWYTSGNDRLPDIPRTAIRQPDYHRSSIAHPNARLTQISGNEIRIRFFGGSRQHNDDYFVGCLVHVPGTDFYRVVRKYAWDNATSRGKFTLASPWDAAHPVGTNLVIQSFTRYHGDNFVILDARASREDDEYNGRHIWLWWKTPEGREVSQYRKILDYEGDDQKVIIDGTWGENPPMGSEFRIGGKVYAQADSLERKFAFYAPIAPDRTPDTFFQIANYGTEFALGVTGSNITKGTDKVTLGGAPSAVNDFYKDRFLVIEDTVSTTILQYRFITAYDGTTKEVTVSEAWDANIPTGVGIQYRIGQPLFANASNEEKVKVGFWSQDYKYLTYKTW